MKRFLGPTAFVACLLTSILAGHAQDTYSTHSVKIVCDFPAGSSLDIITRHARPDSPVDDGELAMEPPPRA